MDSDGIVQVLLPRTHLHRDTEALHHLVAAQPDDVDTDDLLLRASHDELVERMLLVLLIDHGVVERAEARLVCRTRDGKHRGRGPKRALTNLDVVRAVLLARFRLGEADGTDGGVTICASVSSLQVSRYETHEKTTVGMFV